MIKYGRDIKLDGGMFLDRRQKNTPRIYTIDKVCLIDDYIVLGY